MPIQVSCQGCQKSFRVKDDYAGKKIRCPACKGVLDVPGIFEVEVSDALDDIPSTPTQKGGVPKGGMVRGRTERDYIHRVCGTSTTVDGPEFSALADPLARMVSTYCVKCDDHFPIDQFSWADSQEKLSDYYRRYQEKASPFQNFLASRMGMFSFAGALFVLGLIGALVLGSLWLVAVAVLLAIVAIVVHVLVLAPWVLKQAFGTSDARELN
jgi:hypothetical protein